MDTRTPVMAWHRDAVWRGVAWRGRRKRFINAFYNPEARPRALLPTAIHVSQSVQLWSDYFLRWVQYPTRNIDPMELELDDGVAAETAGAATLTQQFRRFDKLNETMHDRGDDVGDR